jgi:hypothetical protein
MPQTNPSPARVARSPGSGELTHLIALSPPRVPGGKGDDGRWSLLVYAWPVGQRTAIYGLMADDYDGAKAEARRLLGRTPRWKKVGPSLVAERKEG